MISYFKYTGGESFALSGKDYAGLFTVQDGRLIQVNHLPLRPSY